jgi:hypothetical protein
MLIKEEIKRIREVMGLSEQLEEKRNLDTFVMVYPKGMGVEYGEEIPTSETYYIPLGAVLPNEIFKDEDYFMSNENVLGMIKKLKEGEELEPIMVIQHPEDEDVFLVMDGHHRRFSYDKADKLEIPARIIEYDNILLADENGQVITSLDKVKNDVELLRNYFVSPDGIPDYSKQD